MLSLYRTLSVRYWWSRRLRAVLVIASIALGVATWVATGALEGSLDRASRQAADPLAGDADLYVSNGDAGVLRDLAGPASSVPGVRLVRPLVLQLVLLPELGRRPALLLGMDVAGDTDGEPTWSVQYKEHDAHSCFRGVFMRQRPALVGRQLDALLPADETRVSVLVSGIPYALVRAGTIDGWGPASALGGSVLVMSCSDAAALLGRADRVTRLDVTLQPGADREEVCRLLKAELAGRAEVWTPEGHDGRVQDMLRGLKVGASLCGAGALLVGLFLVYNVLAVGVAERRHDLGVLRSLGATREQVALLCVGEALLLGLMGGVLGLPLGLGLGQAALGPMQQVLSDVFLPLSCRQLEITPALLLSAASAGMLAALLAALVPALQAARAAPADAIRRVPPASGGVRTWLRGGTGTALLVLGALAIACKPHLPPRLGTHGGLVLILLAALVAIPLLTRLLARLLQPVAGALMGVAGRLALDNLVRAPGRTGVVIAALAAGVALLLQTGGLIRSNESAMRSWVDFCVAGDLFVTSGGPLSAGGRTVPMGMPLAERLREVCPTMRVVPMRFRYLDWHANGRRARALLMVLDAAGYYQGNQDRDPPLADLELWGQLSEPGTALVSDNFAALHGTRPGDTLVLPGSDGSVSLRVLGIVSDYSCAHGTIFVDRAHARRQFNADLVDVFDVYLPKGADHEQVRRELLQAPWAGEQGLCVLTRQEVRSHILGMVGRLYGLAYVQEVVVGLVAVLGVVAAVLISVLQRRRELGLLRAAGATRAQVLRSVLAEALFMGVLGTVVGVLLGLPLEWYTVRVILFEEAGFVCPLKFPWTTAAAVVILALTGALIAGLGPALHATRLRIPEAIAHE
jgi:putative ABC transport system permease protein